MQSVLAVGRIKALPGPRESQHLLDPTPEFIQQVVAANRAALFVIAEGLIEIGFGGGENADRHGRALRRMRSITSSTGAAVICPARKAASRLFASASHSASICWRSESLMLSRSSSASASRSIGSN